MTFTNEALKYLFQYYGEITSVRTVPSPKGMGGLVQFSDPYAAATAIAALNGALVDGQILVVQMAKKEPGVSAPPLDLGGNFASAGTNIWVGNLPISFTEQNLESIFQAYGSVISVKMLQTPSALGDAAGLVNFSSEHEAAAAIQSLNGSYLPNHPKPLMLKYAANQSGHSPNDNPELANSPNVWVGNVPLNYTDADLAYLFKQYGNVVSSKIVLNKVTGTSDGAGLVNFSTTQEAINAINSLNGVTLDGFDKPLLMKHARPVGSVSSKNNSLQSPYGAMGGFGSMLSQLAGGYETPASTNLWVGNLPSSYSENDLRELFKMCGRVSSIKVLQGGLTGHADGACLVNFVTPIEAQNAQSMLNDLQLPMHDKTLVARPAKTPGVSNTQTSGLQSLLQMQMGNSLGMSRGMGGMGSLAGGSSSTNLWVGNLPLSYTEADINMLFGSCGTIVSSVVLRDKATGVSKKSAMVQYSRPEEAQAAVASVNGFRADPTGLPIIVKYASNASKNSPQIGMNTLAALQRTAVGMGRGAYGQGFHPYAR